MNRQAQEPLRPLAWAALAFATGVLLHIDRIPVWASATALVCIAWRLLVGVGTIRLPSAPVRIFLMLVLITAVYFEFRTLNGLNAGTVLLVAMGAIKLVETKTRRDRGIVAGVALVLLLAACLDRQSLLRAPLYLLHAWLCCTAFALNSHDGKGVSTREAILLAGRCLLIAMPLALLLFVFFPRVAGAFWALPRDTQAMTGLADMMSPGSISELTESSDPAFRVTFLGNPPPPEERYWRGPVLHDFDGYTWRREPGRFYRQEDLLYLGQPYVYKVTLEPHTNRWWFALDTIRRSPERNVFLTFDRQLIAIEPVSRQVTYEAVSYTQTKSVGPLSRLARRYDTALPANRNRRTIELARTMRASAGTDIGYLQAVLGKFRTGGFEYTLTPPRLDYDSVDDFLFNTRQGFCGHYASAFVTLMRAAGMPARVVTGYLGGEWNPIGRFHIVRQSDAHAWAEVWLDGRGWTRVDPTAVVAPERLRRGILDLLPNAGTAPDRLMRGFSWFARTRQSWDALNAWWDESVVRFDFTTQLDLLRALGVKDPDWRQLGWALSAGLALWLAWLTWHMRHRVKPAPPDPLARAYLKLCDKLAKSGLARQPHEGPLAYASALAGYRPDIADQASPLLERYAQLRYGTATDGGEFERAVGKLKTPKAFEPFPHAWRELLTRTVPLYKRMPDDTRRRIEPLILQFLKRIQFVGCDGLVITDTMRLAVAAQASLLIVGRGGFTFDELRSVLIYPDQFVVEESEMDDAGVVTQGAHVLSGQTLDTSSIVLSWRDIHQKDDGDDAYNVVLHEFAHYLDHSLTARHDVLKREYEALCAAVARNEQTLIDPYGAEHPAEFFAVATEAFFEKPREMEARHPQLYALLRNSYEIDPARWT